jgi:nucleoside-diphosphate-sugar epimerase
MKVLLTGGTGFIGQALVQALAKEHQLFLLVRPESMAKAEDLFRAIPDINLISGDLSEGDICSSISDLILLEEQVESIVHLGGQYQLDMSALDAYSHNIIGTQNLLFLAKKLSCLKAFHHISSYSVNGAPKKKVMENELNRNNILKDKYAASKLTAEIFVGQFDLPGVKKRVYRPGIVIGDTKVGKIQKIDGPYYFIDFVTKIKALHPWIEKLGFFPFPCSKDSRFPIIPVDILANWLAQAVENPSSHTGLRTYHFIYEQNLLMKDFLEKTLELMGLNVPIKRIGRNSALKFFLPLLGFPAELMEYLYSTTDYDITQRQKDFPGFDEVGFEVYGKPMMKGHNQFVEGARL